MTDQEFRKQLDELVTQGLRELGAGVVYGHVSTVKQFVEVVYDSNIVNYLQSLQNKSETKKGASE